MMICINNQRQLAKHQSVSVQKYGANHLGLGSGPLSGPLRQHIINESSHAHRRVGTSGKEQTTSTPISKQEGTSKHHLSTMPRLLQPPLSLRMPCFEGIRQRRPRRERICGRPQYAMV